MGKFRPLINGQSIRIDNHTSGKPMTWDWLSDEKRDDIHLDKSLNDKVNKKRVKVRITLNSDKCVTKPKKCERKDKQWMAAYNKMLEEVRGVLNSDPKTKNQLIEDISASIKEIGPNKLNRAIKKALRRIAGYFDLPEEMLVQFRDLSKGTVAFYYDQTFGQHYYVGFGTDNAFYLGEGNGRDFTRRVHKLCEEKL